MPQDAGRAPLPLNLVAAGILPAVEPGLPEPGGNGMEKFRTPCSLRQLFRAARCRPSTAGSMPAATVLGRTARTKIGRPTHEPVSKSGSKLHALQTLPRRFNVTETREAFGVRPACWRFEPLNRRKTFNNQHPTSNIQRSSFDPFLDVGRSMLMVECSRGFVGREIV